MTTPIPFYDFGGAGLLLHFAHPNAYTPACFRQMIAPLLPHFRVLGVCHRPLWPGSRPAEVASWQVVADDLLRFLDEQGATAVIGVGHSLGAVATMFAALKRPSLFRALVMIEPVFLPPPVLAAVAAAPPGMPINGPMVQGALRRRNRWPNRQAAFERLRTKNAFRHWSDEALWDYVRYALHETADGEVTLTYSREWEAHFYAMPPLTVWADIPHVTQPTLAVRGTESDTLTPQSWQLWQMLQPQAHFVEVEAAGHMVPMERPLLVAGHVLDFLRFEI